MRCRKSGANIYIIIVMALLFTSADRRSTISAAEPGFALIVRSGDPAEPVVHRSWVSAAGVGGRTPR